jgi:hypothetical protein
MDEEARLKRHNELVKLLEETTRPTHDPYAIDQPRTEVVPGTIPQFLRRLRAIAAPYAFRRFPTDTGYFQLQGVRAEPLDPDYPNDRPVITLDGLLRERGGGMILHPRLIYFTIYELKGGNLAVEAICTHPALAETYHVILKELGWPI